MRAVLAGARPSETVARIRNPAQAPTAAPGRSDWSDSACASRRLRVAQPESYRKSVGKVGFRF